MSGKTGRKTSSATNVDNSSLEIRRVLVIDSNDRVKISRLTLTENALEEQITLLKKLPQAKVVTQKSADLPAKRNTSRHYKWQIYAAKAH